MKIVIFGKNGQVGSALVKEFGVENGFQIDSYSAADVDFSDVNSLEIFLNNLKKIPDLIINAAAYTNVDKAEEERDLADKINHQAVKILADFCAQKKVILIHYSTDYVFDGSGNEEFAEDNSKNLHPLNHYGKTKLDGENSIIKSGCNYLIFRTSWVWSANGKNFVNTIKRLAQEREELNIVSDQIGAPTSAEFIAQSTIKIIKKLPDFKSFPSGIYHLVENENMSWYDFALKIIENLKNEGEILKVKKINPISSDQYKTPAKRPLNSRLNTKKISRFLNKKI